MADLKISQLTGATTPVAGTEVLPIVQSGSTKKVSIDNLTTGKYVPANGMTFPATQVASADPNTLDDYEEGTWTPRPVPPTGTITTYTSTGRYTKIGRSVTVTFNVVISNVGTATNLTYIADLPFTAAAGNDEAVAAMREQVLTGLMWSGTVKASATVINTFRYDNNSPIANNFDITGSVTYFV